MSGRKRTIFCILALATASLAADLLWGPHARLGPGRRLPTIELAGPGNSPVYLSAYSGKVILLDFFASW